MPSPPSPAVADHRAPDGTAALYLALQHQFADRTIDGQSTDHPITVLHISAAHCVLVSGTRADNSSIRMISAGSLSISTLCFTRNPPDAGDLERAIAHIEDAVMPERAHLAPHSALHTADSSLRHLALVCEHEAQPQMSLAIDEVEALFQRLAARSEGRPVSQDPGLPADPDFAATLLILREAMHHLGFDTLHICPDALV